MSSPPDMAVARSLVADMLGLVDPQWVSLGDASTSVVYRVVGQQLVVRFTSGVVPVDVLAAQIRWSAVLAGAGVPFVVPAIPVPLEFEGGTATVWEDLGLSLPVNYPMLGETLRQFHDAGGTALTGDPHLRAVDDVEHLVCRLACARTSGRLRTFEYDLLARWPDLIADRLERVGNQSAARVLVHDDVWAKNVVQTSEHAYLLDPDNLGWGTADHDLAFVTRAHAAGVLDADEVAGFETAYGRRLPDLDVSWTHAYVHRLRWVLNMVERRHLVAADEVALVKELPLWGLPRGARDVPDAERPAG